MAATAQDTVALLSHVPVFEELAAEDLERVADVAVPRHFEAGQVVFREGDDSDTCYVVSTGHARAIRSHSDGRTITLATFGPDDIFGELAMFDDEKRSATVEAVEAVDAIAILGSDMRRLLREHPELAVKLVTALGRRLRAANERLARQSFQTVQSRVAQVVSQLAGSSRESASRFLAVLERAGVITQGRGRITVHDAAALQRYVF
jgi:CRP-like cAMP-binding protein